MLAKDAVNIKFFRNYRIPYTDYADYRRLAAK